MVNDLRSDFEQPVLSASELREAQGFPAYYQAPACFGHTQPIPLEATFDGTNWVVDVARAEATFNG